MAHDIIYKELRFKNVLSYGNVFTKIRLDTNRSAIITGKNGRGKSVFLDALHYVLTGKPFRKINLPQFPNQFNKKDCLVELDFSVGKNNFTIRRGMNPNIFEIIRNGVSLDEESKISDFQKTLEGLCRFNPKNLKSTTIMSSMGYKPFLEMNAGEKRTFIDDILDTDIYTQISAVLKRALTLIKDEIRDTEKDIEREESNLKIIREMNEKAKFNNDDLIAELKESIKTTGQSSKEEMDVAVAEHVEKSTTAIKELGEDKTASIDNLVQNNIGRIAKLKEDNEEIETFITEKRGEIISLESEIIEMSKEIESQKTSIQKRQELLAEKINERDQITSENNDLFNKTTNEISVIRAGIVRDRKQIAFLDKNVVCSQCNHELDDDFKGRELEILSLRIAKNEDALKGHEETLDQVAKTKKKLIVFGKKITGLTDKILSMQTNLVNLEKLLSSATQRISSLNYTIEDKERLSKKNVVEINWILENQESKTDDLKRKYDEKIQGRKDSLPIEIDRIKNSFKKRFNDFKESTLQKIETLSNVEKMELKDENGSLIAINSFQKALEKLNYKKRIHESAINLTSDKIIKAYVFKRYLPVLNKFVNEYLEYLEAPYRLMFDENLNERIVARGYEKLSYGSFSSGERARCDLSLVFAFLELSRVKNSSNSNIIILDEVADNSMDKDGIVGILSIISRLKSKEYTPFVISHRDEMKESFDDTYVANKNLFSTLELAA